MIRMFLPVLRRTMLALVSAFPLFVGSGGTVSAGVDRWTAIALPGAARATAVAVDPADAMIVRVATDDGMIHKSIDGGGTWTSFDLASVGFGGSPRVATITIADFDRTLIVVGADFDRVYVSEDGGMSWDRHSVEGGASQQIIQSIVLFGSAGAIGGALAGASNGLWLSADPDLSDWQVDGALPTCDIAALGANPTAPFRLYVGGTCGLQARQPGDMGGWAAVDGIDGSVAAYVGDPAASDTGYAATGAGIFKVQNDSRAVTAMGRNNGLRDQDVRALLVDPRIGAVLYAGTGSQGVFKGRTAGTGAWLPLNAGLGATPVKALAVSRQDPRILYAITGDGRLFGIAQTSVLPQPADLAVAVSAEAAPVAGVGVTNRAVTARRGDRITYRITVTNRGPGRASWTAAVAEFSRGLELDKAMVDSAVAIAALKAPAGECDLRSQSCKFGPLAPGTAAEMILTAVPQPRFGRGVLRTTVNVAAAVADDLWGIGDPDRANDRASVDVDVR